mgnify:CR=1 FL=1
MDKNVNYRECMTFLELRQKAKFYPIFRTVDVLKWFPDAKKESVLHQLSLWLKKGYLEHLRRDLYVLGDSNLADSRVQQVNSWQEILNRELP